MKKNDLIAAIAAKENCTKKDAEKAVNLVLTSMTDALAAGEKISIAGFGTFEIRRRESKTCINPRTKEKMTTKACNVLAFKAGKALKDAINPAE